MSALRIRFTLIQRMRVLFGQQVFVVFRDLQAPIKHEVIVGWPESIVTEDWHRVEARP